MTSEGVANQRRHTATSQNGCLKTWSKSRGKHGIVLDGGDWYGVRHGRLIITSNGNAKKEEEYCGHLYLQSVPTRPLSDWCRF